MEIKYDLDKSVSNAVARGLQLRGIDVTTSKDAGLPGSTDKRQLEFALTAGRVLVTHDDDFLRIHARTTNPTGIAYAHQPAITAGQTVLSLVALHRDRSAESIDGSVEFLQRMTASDHPTAQSGDESEPA